MPDGDDLHGEIDDILTELLPSKSEEVEEPADHTDPSPEFTELQRSLTYSNQHPEAYILETGKAEIRNLCDTIEEAESDQRTAEQLFEQYLERSEAEFVVEPYAAAALYCACKINGSGVTPTQFASASYDFIEQKHLFRRAKRVMTVLNLNVEAFFDATQYVDTFSEALDVPHSVRKQAHELIENGEQKGVTAGKSPTAVAAAAVYAAGVVENRKITQNEVAKVADVSTVSIRNRYRELLEI